ncbi:MAG: ABC transporter ATP-binding protein [Actinomycetota bacterium]|nr:ABC transporter ATP-binding protein [Actinomycetota bacterium]
MSAVVATGLGKRYRHRWGLRDCTFEIPEGRVTALVGPNGAGKTTLLHLATGLLEPSAGSIEVLGRTPARDRELLPLVGFVAQDVPLYRTFTVRDMLEFGRHLNGRWDSEVATGRLDRLGIPLDQRVGHLSGGQRAQVALALALAKRPRVLLLDEPLASLDPLARREFLQGLMEGVAEDGLTVVLSSHLIADLERVCDHLILLSASRTQAAGDIEDLLRSHRVITAPDGRASVPAGVASVLEETRTERQTTMLVRTDGPILDPTWSGQDVTLEELVLAYLGQPNSTALPPPRLATVRTEVSR